jgi:hypothetical protein
VGTAFRGGPIVNSDGEVVAIASRAYAPQGFDPGAVLFAPTVQLTCDKILHCPRNGAVTAGSR